MKSFSELIKQRRSMRKFTDEELTQEEVVTLLKAALMSPSSKRSNCWQFIAVDDKETLDKLSRCKEMGSSFLKEASLAIVVLADPLASDVWIEDASIASLMIQLQAEDLGLGSCWIQVRERYTATGMSSDEYVHGILGIYLTDRIGRPSDRITQNTRLIDCTLSGPTRSKRSDRTDMNQQSDPTSQTGIDHMRRNLRIDCNHLFVLFRIKRNKCRTMEHHPYPRKRRSQRMGIVQFSLTKFNPAVIRLCSHAAQRFTQLSDPPHISHQKSYPAPSLQQFSDQMTADQSGSSGDRNPLRLQHSRHLILLHGHFVPSPKQSFSRTQAGCPYI